jgi:hypothetical protein
MISNRASARTTSRARHLTARRGRLRRALFATIPRCRKVSQPRDTESRE